MFSKTKKQSGSKKAPGPKNTRSILSFFGKNKGPQAQKKKLISSKEIEEATRWPSRKQILFSDDDNAGGKSAFTLAIAPQNGGAYC